MKSPKELDAETELYNFLAEYRLKKSKISEKEAELFQEDIFQYTKIKIRIAILISIVGGIHPLDISNSERDGIAMYCGYSDFNAFFNAFVEGKSPKHISKKFWIPGMLLIVFFVLVYWIIRLFLFVAQ